MNIRQTDELSSKHANAVVCFVVRGFDDLLIPLRDVSTLDVPAATFGHSVKVTYSQSVRSLCTKINKNINDNFEYCT